MWQLGTGEGTRVPCPAGIPPSFPPLAHNVEPRISARIEVPTCKTITPSVPRTNALKTGDDRKVDGLPCHIQSSYRWWRSVLSRGALTPGGQGVSKLDRRPCAQTRACVVRARVFGGDEDCGGEGGFHMDGDVRRTEQDLQSGAGADRRPRRSRRCSVSELGRRSSSVHPTYIYRSLSCYTTGRDSIQPCTIPQRSMSHPPPRRRLPRLESSHGRHEASTTRTAGSSPFAARWIFQNETPGSPSWESQFKRRVLLVINIPLPGTGCCRVCGRRREKTGEGIGGCCRCPLSRAPPGHNHAELGVSPPGSWTAPW